MTAVYGLLNIATSVAQREIGQLEAALAPYDLARLRRLVADWPGVDSEKWSEPEVVADHRHALLGGISAAGFMRKVAGSNH